MLSVGGVIMWYVGIMERGRPVVLGGVVSIGHTHTRWCSARSLSGLLIGAFAGCLLE